MALSKIDIENMVTGELTTTNGGTGATSFTAGKVGQVVQASTSTAVNVASTSVADTGLTVNNTPTATTSKVLVQVNQNILTDIDTELGNSKIKLLRDSTTAIDFTTNIARVEANGSSAVKFGNLTTFSHLDSPSTTSQITYKTQGAISSTSNNGTARFQNSSVPSIITVMEIFA